MAKGVRGSDQFQIRLPTGMRDRIKSVADANNRSMNAEIVSALEEKFPEPEPLFQAIFDLYHLYATDLISDDYIKDLPPISRRILDAWIRMSLFRDGNLKDKNTSKEVLRSSVEQIMQKRNLDSPSDIRKFIDSIRDPDLSGLLEDQE